MNFFYHNDDPLLSRYNSSHPNTYDNSSQLNDNYAQIYRQQIMQEMQQQGQNELTRDWIGDLDKKMRKLKPDIVEQLNNNEEFTRLNNEIQGDIQSEIISLVKYKLNGSQNIKNNIQRQIEIIDTISEQTQDEERKNMLELNDYMKNYSHLTFDEYKRIKNGENIKPKKNTKEEKK